MSNLEQRYRRLLRAYPRSYREARGSEILGTLLEANAPGGTRPTARDTWALILGGLKERSGTGQLLTVAESMRLIVLLAACLEIVSAADFWFRDVRGSWGDAFPSMAYGWISLVLGLLAVATAALAWTRWRTATLVVTAATAALWFYHPEGNDWANSIQPVLALALIAILAVTPGRPRLPWAWFALPAALLVTELAAALSQAYLAIPGIGIGYVPFVLLAGTILWSIVDVRPAASTGIWIAWFLGVGSLARLTELPRYMFGMFVAQWPAESLALLALLIALIGIRRLRRQSAL